MERIAAAKNRVGRADRAMQGGVGAVRNAKQCGWPFAPAGRRVGAVLGVVGIVLAFLSGLALQPSLVWAQEFEDDRPIVEPRPAPSDTPPTPLPSDRPRPQPRPMGEETAGTGTAEGPLLPGAWPMGESETPLPMGETNIVWGESSQSYDVDYLNPLRYIDQLIDLTMTEINQAINGFIAQLEEHEANRFQLFARYRIRWTEKNDYDLLPGVRDRDIFIYDAWRIGATLTMDVLEWNVSVQNVVGWRTDIGEDKWDIHELNVRITGFEGDAIRFPVDFLDTWFRFIAYVGRGPLILGRGRLLGSDDFVMRGENFDAVILGLVDSATGGGLSVFGMMRTKYDRRGFNSNHHSEYLSGVALIGLDPFGQASTVEDQIDKVLFRSGEYDTAQFPVVNSRERRLAAGFDLYAIWFYTNRKVEEVGEPNPQTGIATAGRVDMWSVGLRGAVLHEEALTIEAEAVLQFGRRGGNSVFAYYVHGEVTLGIDWAVPTTLTAVFDWASGDNDPLDGKQNGFDTLFPISHGRLGLIDMFAMRNIVRWGGTVRVQIANTVALTASFDWLRSVTPNDAVYGPTSQEVRMPADPSASRELGIVIGGTIEYHYSPRIHIFVGAAQFLPGTRFTRAGQSASALVIYAASELRF